MRTGRTVAYAPLRDVADGAIASDSGSPHGLQGEAQSPAAELFTQDAVRWHRTATLILRGGEGRTQLVEADASVRISDERSVEDGAQRRGAIEGDASVVERVRLGVRAGDDIGLGACHGPPDEQRDREHGVSRPHQGAAVSRGSERNVAVAVEVVLESEQKVWSGHRTHEPAPLVEIDRLGVKSREDHSG